MVIVQEAWGWWHCKCWCLCVL